MDISELRDQHQSIVEAILLSGDIPLCKKRAAETGIPVTEARYEGINIVTASLLANIPHDRKLAAVKETAALVEDPETWIRLLGEGIWTIPPDVVQTLNESGTRITRAIVDLHSTFVGVFALVMPFIPAPVMDDFLAWAESEMNFRPSGRQLRELTSSIDGISQTHPDFAEFAEKIRQRPEYNENLSCCG